jgi:shikimate dehydrogenase
MHHAALGRLAEVFPASNFSATRYLRIEVDPERLSEALILLHEKGFQGINLTIPHKVEALASVYSMEDDARRMGAVNTLRWLPAGFHGFNTDGYGIEAAIKDELGLDFVGKRIVLLGAGGAARATAVQCLKSGCRELWVGNRTATRLEALLETLERDRPAGEESRVRGFLFTDVAHTALDLASASDTAPLIVINATAAGLAPGDEAPVPLACLGPVQAVYDMIYKPSVTPLMREAAALGIPAVNGLGMLVHQGARALELWTGETASAAVMRKAAEQALSTDI